MKKKISGVAKRIVIRISAIGGAACSSRSAVSRRNKHARISERLSCSADQLPHVLRCPMDSESKHVGSLFPLSLAESAGFDSKPAGSP